MGKTGTLVGGNRLFRLCRLQAPGRAALRALGASVIIRIEPNQVVGARRAESMPKDGSVVVLSDESMSGPNEYERYEDRRDCKRPDRKIGEGDQDCRREACADHRQTDSGSGPPSTGRSEFGLQLRFDRLTDLLRNLG